MKKPDWAYAKAEQHMRGYMNLKTEQELFAHLAKLLRTERALAVRACRREKVSGETGTEGDRAYNHACDDCAAAIRGGR